MTVDRLEAQRQFRAQQRVAVADAQRLPVEQARERLRALADEERTFFEDQQRAARSQAHEASGGRSL